MTIHMPAAAAPELVAAAWIAIKAAVEIIDEKTKQARAEREAADAKDAA